MGFSVRLILSIYRRLYLVSCPYPSVLCPFVGGGDLVCLSYVSRAGGGLNKEEIQLMPVVELCKNINELNTQG